MSATMELPSFRVGPVELDHAVVRVEPMRPEHAPDLWVIGRDAATWRWMPTPVFASPVDAANWVARALDDQLHGRRVPFVIRRRSDGMIVGSTSFLDIRAPERALEIGWTWLAPAACGSAVNTATKLLLLTHAFDTLGAGRVQLKTDARNHVSQAAIERLGAKREGVLRKHMRLHDGFVRDTVFYSILPEEWPAIKGGLTERLARG